MYLVPTYVKITAERRAAGYLRKKFRLLVYNVGYYYVSDFQNNPLKQVKWGVKDCIGTF